MAAAIWRGPREWPRGAFKPVKTFFHKLQHASIRKNENLGAHRLFVRNITTAWVEAMRKDTILNAWRACGLVPFNPDHFLRNCPSHRLRQPPAEPPTTLDPVPTVPTPPPSASQEELSSLGPSASQCAQVEKLARWRYGGSDVFCKQDQRTASTRFMPIHIF